MSMRATVLIMLAGLVAVAGCSTPLTERASLVRVIPQEAVAASGCKTLGSVAGRSHPVLLESAAESEAMAYLRDAAARMDANAVTVVNTTTDNEVVTIRGLALKCP